MMKWGGDGDGDGDGGGRHKCGVQGDIAKLSYLTYLTQFTCVHLFFGTVIVTCYLLYHVNTGV